MSYRTSNRLLLLLSFAVAVASFLMFRAMISPQSSPFTTEIAAAVMGGLLTVAITAVLLRVQTDVELRKDQNAKLLEARLQVYGELMGALEELLGNAAEVSERDVIRVAVLNQRLISLAAEPVVRAFSAFAKLFAEAARNGRFELQEINALLGLAGELSIQMRLDLLTSEEVSDFKATEASFREVVGVNVAALAVPFISEAGFFELCDAATKQYYGRLIEHLAAHGIPYRMGTKGVSVAGGLLWCFPSSSARNLELRRAKLSPALDTAATDFFASHGLTPDRLSKPSFAFRPDEVPLEALLGLLGQLLSPAE